MSDDMNSTNPVALLESLDADAIAARLDELEREAQALRVLLRSARARQGAKKRAEAHPAAGLPEQSSAKEGRQ
jgi:hypothetical protein